MGRSRLTNLPERIAAGAYVLSSGLTKLQSDAARAGALRATPASSYTVPGELPAESFTKLLGVAECAVGGTLLLPLLGDGLAGVSLSAVAGGLLGLHLKTSAVRQEGGLRPSQQGELFTGDAVLLGIGLSLMGHSVGARRQARRVERAKRSVKRSSGGGSAAPAASASGGH